jgi:hypothetical protein
MSKNTDLGSLVNYIKGQVTGRLNAPAYTSATAFTGTIAGYLGFDTSGNILTTAGSFISGSGTTNYIPKFTASGTIGNSVIQDDGTNVLINNANNIYAKLNIKQTSSTNYGGIAIYSNNGTETFLGIGNTGSLTTLQATYGSTGSYIPLTFNTGGLERMRILSTGNILINDTSSTYGSAFGYNLGVKGISSQSFISIARFGQTLDSQGMILGLDTTAGYVYLYDNLPLVFVNNSAERMRITTAGGLNINTSTTGYTFNAISATFTQFNTSFKGVGSLINIMSRFMQDTSTNRGIAIGYAYDFELISGIWATQDTGTLMLGVRVGSNYKSKININTTTVGLDIPSSSAGLGGGQLYNDGGYVRIV